MNCELFEDGSTRLSIAEAAFVFRRPRPGVLVVTGTGWDRGQFGDVPFEEIEAEGARFGPLELFIDTSGMEFVEVSERVDGVISEYLATVKDDRSGV